MKRLMKHFNNFEGLTLIDKNEALKFISNNRSLNRSNRILLTPEANIFAQVWTFKEVEYDILETQDNALIYLEMPGTEIYLIRDSAYEEYKNKKSFIKITESELNGSNAIFYTDNPEHVLEQFVTVTEKEFYDLLNSCPVRLVRLQSIVIDEATEIYFMESNSLEYPDFVKQANGFIYPRILFKKNVSGPAMVDFYYVNKFYYNKMGGK